MVAILREADKTPVAEVAKKHKISEQTIQDHPHLVAAMCQHQRRMPVGERGVQRLFSRFRAFVSGSLVCSQLLPPA
jgi:hypothetical protein